MIRLFFRILLLICIFLCANNAMQAKSLPKAMVMSALLPGCGEIYSGHLNRGVALIAADAVLLFGADRFGRETNWLESSYKQYALSKAGIETGGDSEYYKLLNDYYSSELYNDEIEQYFRNLGLARFNNPNYYSEEITLYSISDHDAWNWQSISDWQKYRSIRKDRQKMVMNRKLVIGAAIFNRVISVLDAAYLTRNYNRKHRASISIQPDLINDRVILSCAWEF